MSKCKGNVVAPRRGARPAGRRRLPLVPVHRLAARGTRAASRPTSSTRSCASSCSRSGTPTASSSSTPTSTASTRRSRRVPLAERPLLDRWVLAELQRLVADGHRRPGGLRRHQLRAAPSRSSSTTSPTGTCAAAAAASGRARATPTSWPPTRRCTSAWSRSPSCWRPTRPSSPRRSTRTSCAAPTPRRRCRCTSATGREADAAAVDERVAFDMAGGAARRRDGPRRAQRRRRQEPPAAGRGRRRGAGRPSARRSRACATSSSTSSTSRTLRLVDVGRRAARLSAQAQPQAPGPAARQAGRRGRRALWRRSTRPSSCARCAAPARRRSRSPTASELRLAEDEVLVETASPEGYRVEHDGTRTVALATIDRRRPARRGSRARARARGAARAQERRPAHRGHDRADARASPATSRVSSSARRRLHRRRDAGQRAS